MHEAKITAPPFGLQVIRLHVSGCMPHRTNFDMSLYKSFKPTERVNALRTSRESCSFGLKLMF
jgi:hypothetical protein